MFGKVNWHPSRSEIRYFAITLLIATFVFAIILFLLSRREVSGYVVVGGLLLSIPSYIVPRFGRYVYLLWMAISYLLGRIISPIVTAVIFYLLITSLGLFFRLVKRDTLELKRPKNRTSYFHQHPDISDRNHFRRQF